MSSRKKPRSSTVPVSTNDDATAMSRTFREVAPAHYLFQIKSFSLLSSTEEERFESGNFSSGGYQWKLCLYPNGDKKEDGEGHVSLYLAISETDTLPPGWEVNVNFKLFVYDKVRDNYLTIQDADARVSRFHKLKTACGFSKLISLDTFNEISNGYLVDDSCVFGAEVFVIKCTGGGQCLSVIKELLDNTYTWEIKKFSEVEDTILHSNAFFVGNHEWKLLVYPKGTGNGEGNSLSLFLELADCGTIPSKPALYVEFFLRVKDGLHGEYYQRKAHSWFCTETESWGFHKMVSLAELHDKSKGFIVEGTLEVEVQIDVMAVVKDFSKS